MEVKPYPGGFEIQQRVTSSEYFVGTSRLRSYAVETTGDARPNLVTDASKYTNTGKDNLVARAAAVRHSLVNNNKREMASIEFIAAAKNLSKQRLCDEQQSIMGHGSFQADTGNNFQS